MASAAIHSKLEQRLERGHGFGLRLAVMRGLRPQPFAKSGPTTSVGAAGDAHGAAGCSGDACRGTPPTTPPQPADCEDVVTRREVSAARGATPPLLVKASPPAPSILVQLPPGGAGGAEPSLSELQLKREKLQRHRLVCSEIIDAFLYVAGQDVARDAALLAASGITHVLNCAGPHCPNFLESREGPGPKLSYLRLDMYDHRSEDISWFMYPAFDFIASARAAGGRVLVHCVQGVSRSCALAIAWVMLSTGCCYQEAYDHVRQRRGICAPNTGFMCALLEWQKRRRQPPPQPFLLRTGWHVPFFAADLLLKLCIREEDRGILPVTTAAFDPRACFVVVVPAAVFAAAAASASTAKTGQDSAPAAEEVRGAAIAGPCHVEIRPMKRFGSAASAAAMRSAVMTTAAAPTPELSSVGAAPAAPAAFVWRGSESHPQMLELAQRGVQWLVKYEGCVAVPAPHGVVEQSRESPLFLAAIGAPQGVAGVAAAHVAIYKDLEPDREALAPAGAACVVASSASEGLGLPPQVCLNIETPLGGTGTVPMDVDDAPAEAQAAPVPAQSTLLFECINAAAGGLRWSRLAVYDDQDLQEDACFLLVTPERRCFAWAGAAFVDAHISNLVGGDCPENMRALLAGVTADAEHAALLASVDVGPALRLEAGGAESEDFWTAYEAGY